MKSFIISLFFLIKANALTDCLKCNNELCIKDRRASLWNNGTCVFDSKNKLENVFITGHIFSLGVCPAVSSKIGKNCFDQISANVAENIASNTNSNFNDDNVCEIFPYGTPCMYSASLFKISAKGYDCGQLKILFENSINECLRNKADRRWWASIGYFIAVLFGLPLILFCISACT